MGTYYKIARPDGWDFFTGKTINYREALGKTVQPPVANHGKPIELCTPTVLHASDTADQCFIGGGLPCSLYVVEGTPTVSDGRKHGFTSLRVIKELDPAEHFVWRYAEAASPLHPFTLTPPDIDSEILELVTKWTLVRDSVSVSVNASVRDSVSVSVNASVWDSVNASVSALAWDSARSSVKTSVGDSIWASARSSVGDLVWAYIGWIFAPVVSDWEYINNLPGEYPYQSAVDLWNKGFMPSYDGKKWRLHGGPNGQVLSEV